MINKIIDLKVEITKKLELLEREKTYYNNQWLKYYKKDKHNYLILNHLQQIVKNYKVLMLQYKSLKVNKYMIDDVTYFIKRLNLLHNNITIYNDVSILKIISN